MPFRELLKRWAYLLSISGKNTKSVVMNEMLRELNKGKD